MYVALASSRPSSISLATNSDLDAPLQMASDPTGGSRSVRSVRLALGLEKLAAFEKRDRGVGMDGGLYACRAHGMSATYVQHAMESGFA